MCVIVWYLLENHTLEISCGYVRCQVMCIEAGYSSISPISNTSFNNGRWSSRLLIASPILNYFWLLPKHTSLLLECRGIILSSILYMLWVICYNNDYQKRKSINWSRRKKYKQYERWLIWWIGVQVNILQVHLQPSLVQNIVLVFQNIILFWKNNTKF